MESKKRNILSTIEGLKASKREFEAQHATLGDLISTLEAQLGEYGVRESVSLPTGMDYISLAVDLDGYVLHFKMKRSALMGKLMSAWCGRRSMRRQDVVFIFNGDRLKDDQTPEQMQDGDVIYAMLHVIP